MSRLTGHGFIALLMALSAAAPAGVQPVLAAEEGQPPASKPGAKADVKPAAKADAAKADAEKKPVQLQKVVLFSSGVGFFEHQGQVQGEAQVDLRFNVRDINDLLKSMVLQDLGGGRVSTVTYGSKDPITKTLQTFAVDLTSNPTLGQILNQLRGERVEIDVPNAVTGVILGVETRKRQVKDQEPVEIEMLNLLTDEGLRSVPLDGVGRIKLMDEKLDAELRQALQVLAMGHTTDKKTVSLKFLGEGARKVRVGYIQETPVWKTSYRLVLDDEKAPFLQGWAIVENTTEEDWKDVNLTLVSGRPISFVMDLYEPLYVSRPVVEPELYASLRPQTYGQDLAARDREFQQAGEKAAQLKRGGVVMRGMGRNRRADQNAADSPSAPSAALAEDASEEAETLNLQQGVASAATAGDVGELFQYAIGTPVTLPRRQSAMLPIVNESVEGQKLSIYNQAVQVKHPLNGLKLKNSTELHLMQGPITVFDGGAYAGDGKIEDLPPGSERLISYALDLDVEVAPEIQVQPEQLLTVRLIKGTLQVSQRFVRTRKYTIKNAARKEKQVLIELPVEEPWKLVSPSEPTEKTRDMLRFAVAAKPGTPTQLNIEQQHLASQSWAVTNVDDNTLLFYVRQKVTSEAVKKALAEVIERKTQIQRLAEERQQHEQKIKEIRDEQKPIRENMAQLDRNTDLYKRYVKKFSDQEDAVEKLREQIQMLTAEETKLRASLDEFLSNLDLE